MSTERLNETTERFARTSRDRNPITEERGRASLGEKVAMVVAILATLFVIGLLIYENGRPV